MNKLLSLLFIVCINTPNLVLAQARKAAITISNASTLNRQEEVVAIDWKDVIAKYPNLDTANFKVVNQASKKEVPYQLEFKGGKDIQNLLVQIDIAAKASVKLTIQKGKPQAVTTKTFGRYVPERKDDFAWENDKIAFRMYGKALELTPKEMAYGINGYQ
jgi:Domain of unknown function (DUF4861)